MSRDRGERYRVVSDEPFAVDPALLGRPLATVRRRAVALSIDTLIVLALSLPIIVGVALLAIRIQTPELYAFISALVRQDYEHASVQGMDKEVFTLVQRRRPGILPPALDAAVRGGDEREIQRVRQDLGLDLDLNVGNPRPSYYDPADATLHVHRDVLFGRAEALASFFLWGIVYFTLLGMRGRTPGKWLLGIRVVRLDGSALGLRGSFERASGYSATLSSFGLGFLDALRDPNRQTLHDRICSTVVVREPRPPGPLRRVLRRRRSPPTAGS